MAKRKAKRKNNTTSKTPMRLIMLAVLILFGWAWRTFSDEAKAEKEAAEAVRYSGLEKVEIPDGTPSQTIFYEGFTVSFNPKHHIPNYAAWELTADEARSTEHERGDFAADRDVIGCPTLDDYRNSGYDRGHMAPAADMKWSKKAMRDCFYLSNMAPQDHKLNAGAWKNLEENCRRWAQRDSVLVIVCGPVLTDKITKRIGKNKVSVPKRFFKVVLAPYANPPRGIGFIMPNSYVEGGVQPAAVTIDEVERITGYDFFSSLPDDIEAQVEAECNFPRWQKKM